MRTTRVSENRNGLRKPMLLIVMPITAVIVVGLIVFFAGAFDSTLAEDEGAGNLATSQLTSGPGEQTSAPEPTAAPKIEPTPMPTAEPTAAPVVISAVVPVEAKVVTKVLPVAKFGEVLDEGWVNLNLPADQTAETWYTLQVDTKTRGITNFFALYNEDSQIVSSIKIENYTKDEPLDNAELTLYYSNGSKRMLYFDGKEGTMSLTQHYPQPIGPSMFSADLRVAMVFYGMELSDETGKINALMNLDFTGLSLGEVLIMQQPSERIVADMLREIGTLVDQVEEQRGS
ncbi:MAG: PT domain-containing protein [Chloroflexi bacterium]|nr:PT domain-containing protein [Chloroflexota bacterium]